MIQLCKMATMRTILALVVVASAAAIEMTFEISERDEHCYFEELIAGKESALRMQVSKLSSCADKYDGYPIAV